MLGSYLKETAAVLSELGQNYASSSQNATVTSIIVRLGEFELTTQWTYARAIQR